MKPVCDDEPMTVVSPCTKVCVIDRETRLCRGCARTIDEISSWGSMSPSERQTVIAKLDHRRALKAA